MDVHEVLTENEEEQRICRKREKVHGESNNLQETAEFRGLHRTRWRNLMAATRPRRAITNIIIFLKDAVACREACGQILCAEFMPWGYEEIYLWIVTVHFGNHYNVFETLRASVTSI